jgi:hypothetical protein
MDPRGPSAARAGAAVLLQQQLRLIQAALGAPALLAHFARLVRQRRPWAVLNQALRRLVYPHGATVHAHTVRTRAA